MKRIVPKCSWLKPEIAGIHLVDKCLIVFMALLLIQSAYSLCFPGAPSSQTSDIDVIIRTSSAAIFGYFLSANFINHGLSSGEPGEDMPDSGAGKPEIEISEVGVHEREQKDRLIKGPGKQFTRGYMEASRLQILMAAGVGLFCLISLIIMRNITAFSELSQSSPSVTATVAQFRDFVSGCVGFLIGCPTSGQRR